MVVHKETEDDDQSPGSLESHGGRRNPEEGEGR